MASPTEVYVDPSIAADSGSGTIGDPYGDLQYALDTVTPDTTNGNRFNIKSGTAEVLAGVLSYASYTTPGFENPAIFQGYNSAAGDGGLFEIDCNGGAGFPSASGIAIIDGHVHNGGSSVLITLAGDCFMRNVEVNNTSGNAIVTSGRQNTIIGCNLHDLGALGISGTSHSVLWCYFKNGTKDFTSAISITNSPSSGVPGVAIGNILSLDGSSNGILVNGAFSGALVIGNSILCAGGTGVGINLTSSPIGVLVMNNLVEGFSGSGGKGYDLNTTTRYQYSARSNGAYNNATNYDIQGEFMDDENDNEALGASPFAKSGSDTFANRFVYFSPVDTGNIYGGAYVG